MAKTPRLSDTAALVSAGSKQETDVSVRPVENGFMIRKSTYGDGSYKCEETFSAERPSITVSTPTTDRGVKEGGSLRDAIKHIKR